MKQNKIHVTKNKMLFGTLKRISKKEILSFLSSENITTGQKQIIFSYWKCVLRQTDKWQMKKKDKSQRLNSSDQLHHTTKNCKLILILG